MPYFEIAISQYWRREIFVFLVFPNQYMAKINSHTKSQTGIVVILFSCFRVGVGLHYEFVLRCSKTKVAEKFAVKSLNKYIHNGLY